MARRFTFGQEDTYNPSRMSPRAQRNFGFELNDNRFNPSLDDDEEEQVESDPYNDIISRYRGALTDERPALGKYRSAMQNMPTRDQYDLGKWGKLGAALAGFGAGFRDPMEGVNVATTLRDAPYRRALADYELNLGNLGNEAQFEHEDRQNRLKGLDLELEALKDRRTADETRRLNSSLIARRAFQNENDAAKTGIDRDTFNMNFTNMNHDNNLEDLMGDSLRTYRNNQTRIGQGNLGARNKELGLRGRIFDHDKEMDLLNLGQRQTEEMGRNRRDSTSSSFLTPSAQDDAETMAMAEVMREFPAYRKFFAPYNEQYEPSLRGDLSDDELNSDEFNMLKAELRGRANRILNMPRGGSGRRFVPEQ